MNAALDRAVDRCIEEGYLREYLLKHRSEVNYMGFFDWDEELWKKTQREIGREEGIREGINEGIRNEVVNITLHFSYTKFPKQPYPSLIHSTSFS